ncbi:hypothetical protein [Polyangium jinanense]|uniref:Uncharacterized protein n=1 Tax=Polyangium jinanense TaxID=2829994 RepID=A0A9X3XCS9_9BACT|nr:hypothetical protein [Polyangium jinanense]MDC3960246.1 hypothetical protein [Polyangium jinanense]MDC3988034.1 hypothetical protein [Polyangium jinanense]
MDDKLDLGQAYAPPVASPPAAPLPGVVSPYDKIVRFSFPVGAAVGLVMGSVDYLRSAYALSFFHAQKSTPGILCVALLRGWGAACAVLAASLTAVILLHRAGRRASGPIKVDHARVYLVLATLPLLSVFTAPFCLLGALLLWLAEPAGTTSEFLASLSDFVRRADFKYLPANGALVGLWLTCLLRIGANWLTTKKHGLALKLFVAYAALAIPNALLRAIFSIVDPV